MKKLFILTAVMAIFGLSSCEKESSEAIVGTWKAATIEMTAEGINVDVDMAEAEAKLLFTFNEDGSGSAYMESKGSGNKTQFEYEVFGDTLTLTIDGETIGIPVSIGRRSMTLEIDGSLLDYENAKVKIHLKRI